MLEEKNDNLQNADGQMTPENPTQNSAPDAQNEIIDETPQEETVAPLDAFFAAEAKENDDVPEDLLTENNDQPIEGNAENEPIEIDDEREEAIAEAIEKNDNIDQTGNVIDRVEHAGATELQETVLSMAESADNDTSTREMESLLMPEYQDYEMDTLVNELEKLVTNYGITAIRDHVEEIKRNFLSKYHALIEEKREAHHRENPDDTEDFDYNYPLKARFDQLYGLYRDKRNAHHKSQQNNLQANLEKRLEIVEELKNLINPQENIKDTLKHFNEIRERWKNAGPIPKDKYNHVWNNYHFHVENFYDYLHLDREARDLDFKHNLELKQKIIARVEELVNENDVNKAFRELQDLHRIWKEEIGPVSRQHREEIWNRFSELTKQMHDKREELFEKQRGSEQENLEKKQAIIAQLQELSKEKVGTHSAWLGQIDKVEALRNEFFSLGKVPLEVNEETWSSFKNAVREFNSLKNSFYKDIKKDQNDNLSKKTALVEKAKELQNSDDFATTTPIMKQIQEEWKQIGHVPRKYSDKLWKEFRGACNHYFERLKESRSEENAEELEAFEKKKSYLEKLREFQMTGDHKTDLAAIKEHIENWKGLGRVPSARRHIEGKFNKILDALFEKLSLSKKDADMMRFSNRLESLAEGNDTRKLENEKIFLMRKIDEVQSEILQLENNIQFFANAKGNNPMVNEVRKNIENHKEELNTLRTKLKQLRSIQTE
ncbi:MAG: DUF349 domain-containing protein [Flavobacterium sp.]|nr:DUF349 domain-containing protein [Flavobacterium sp.]